MKELQLQNGQRRQRTVAAARLYLARGDYFKALHSRPINSITRADVATCLNATIIKRSAHTAGQARTALTTFFVWAMQQGIAESNPVIGTADPGSNPARDRVLSDSELATIWKACKDDDFGKVVKLLTLTGCRRSEIGGLCWSWIDLDQNTLTIPGTLTKNHKPHKLPLAPMMRSIIESTPQRLNRDYVFGQWGEGFCGWNHKAMLNDGIKERWTLHDLRRSAATGMANIGVQPHIIETILNHVSGHKAGDAGIYNRSNYELGVRNALAMWADHIASIISGDERKVVPLRVS